MQCLAFDPARCRPERTIRLPHGHANRAVRLAPTSSAQHRGGLCQTRPRPRRIRRHQHTAPVRPPYRLSPIDLYTSLMISSGGLTHRLGRLENMGPIVREKSAEDGRSLLVSLTPEGQNRAEKAFRADMASELQFLELPEKRETLAQMLRGLLILAGRKDNPIPPRGGAELWSLRGWAEARRAATKARAHDMRGLSKP